MVSCDCGVAILAFFFFFFFLKDGADALCHFKRLLISPLCFLTRAIWFFFFFRYPQTWNSLQTFSFSLFSKPNSVCVTLRIATLIEICMFQLFLFGLWVFCVHTKRLRCRHRFIQYLDILVLQCNGKYVCGQCSLYLFSLSFFLQWYFVETYTLMFSI